MLILTGVCALLLILSFNTTVFEGALKGAAGYVVVPFQKGIAEVGSYFSERSKELGAVKKTCWRRTRRSRKQVDQLTIENNQLQQDR